MGTNHPLWWWILTSTTRPCLLLSGLTSDHGVATQGHCLPWMSPALTLHTFVVQLTEAWTCRSSALLNLAVGRSDLVIATGKFPSTTLPTHPSPPQGPPNTIVSHPWIVQAGFFVLLTLSFVRRSLRSINNKNQVRFHQSPASAPMVPRCYRHETRVIHPVLASLSIPSDPGIMVGWMPGYDGLCGLFFLDVCSSFIRPESLQPHHHPHPHPPLHYDHAVSSLSAVAPIVSR